MRNHLFRAGVCDLSQTSWKSPFRAEGQSKVELVSIVQIIEFLENVFVSAEGG